MLCHVVMNDIWKC
uniref:Uncharacterized protein n=1 Tax=Anguilla anguilla TaxID=7936 RepID=A0A0E9SZU5_ANGAN